jgi:hypothetical protein
MGALATRLQRIERRIAQLRREQGAKLVYIDPVYFARQRLGFEPDPWQERVLQSDSSRLLLNCSRQSGKSVTAAILALHCALYFPRSLVLLVSRSLRQSAELFKKVQDLLSLLPVRPRLDEDSKLSLQLANGSRIVSLPGSEETIRGFSGVSLLIEDEASRVSDSLFFATRPMLAVSQGRHILMSTPWGKRGHFFEAWEHGGAAWERIQITAYECPRIPADFLKEELETLGEWWFKQEYGCQFVETLDQVFSHEHVMSALSDEIEPLFTVAPVSYNAIDRSISVLGGVQ